MAMAVRCQPDLLASMLHMIHLLSRRHASSFAAVPPDVQAGCARGTTLTKATTAEIAVQRLVAGKLTEEKVHGAHDKPFNVLFVL
eukprot:2138715-Pleurochrysis_carterae.AAC.1